MVCGLWFAVCGLWIVVVYLGLACDILVLLEPAKLYKNASATAAQVLGFRVWGLGFRV